MKYIFAFLAALVAPLAGQAITIDLVPIGNPNNAGEINGGNIFGHVVAAYQIGKTEVTNAQYVDFLKAKAASDPLGLYSSSMSSSVHGGITRSGSSGSFTYAVKADVMGVGPGGSDYTYGDKPVDFVSWYSAIRFANWMNNGQGIGSTETGAYILTGNTAVPSNANTIIRSSDASWFLPNEDEWYKAAYYNPASSAYFDYPTGSDTAPDNNLPSADSGNSANFLVGGTPTTGDSDYPLTSVGGYLLSDSPYGTLNQGGGMAEWSETLVSAGIRVRRGGSWNADFSHLASETRDTGSAFIGNDTTGFRLAAPAGVPGDYNGNGLVDAADYVVWRSHLNQTYQLQNEVTGTSPGTVDQDDYLAWRARFGSTSGSGAGFLAGSAAVPEPNAIALAVVSSMLCFASRRRERRG